MVIDESSIVKPAPVIESRTGLLDVWKDKVIQVEKRPYKVVSSVTKVKAKDGIELTTQFVYVRRVTANMVFGAILDKLSPVKT